MENKITVFDWIGRIYRQSIMAYKSTFNFKDVKIFLIAKIMTPLFQMLFFCYLAQYVYHATDMMPWVIGNAFMVCVYSVFLGAGLTMMLERNFGTLKMLIATPTNRFVVFFSRSIIYVVDASATVIIGLIVGKFVFHVDFSGVNFFVFGMVIIVAMFSAISLGMVVSAIGLVVRDINMIMNIGIMGLIGLSGANIPVEKLPFVLQKIAYILPVTRSIQAGRMLASEGVNRRIYELVGQEMVLGLVYLVLGYGMYRAFEYLARKHATLEMF